MDFPKKTITLNNINIINDLFSSYKYCRIFGKGPTFQDKEKSDNILHITANQASNEVTQVDMVVVNDLHNIDKINDSVYENLKFLLIPEYIHNNWTCDKDVTWRNVYEKVKNKFNGYYIIYNLFSSPSPNPNLITLESKKSSCNNACDFVCKYLNSFIIQIDCYGIGFKGRNEKFYHDKFIGNGYYDIARLLSITCNIKKVCEEYKIKFILN